MQQTDMDKYRRHEPPPLALNDFGIRLHPKRHQSRFTAAPAGESHEKKDDNVRGEEDIRERRTTRPDRVEKIEVVFCNHCYRSPRRLNKPQITQITRI